MTAIETSPSVDFRQTAEDNMGRGGLFVYERSKLLFAANSLLRQEMPYGLTVRFAAKANPNAEILRIFDRAGLHFDAGSVDEAAYIIKQGIDGDKISLSSQVLEDEPLLHDILQEGVLPVGTSVRQIEMLGSIGCRETAVRINQGIGAGGNDQTNVGGPTSSFGIWHEQLDEVKAAAEKHGLTINRLHTHIGSGAETDWRKVIDVSLGIVERLPDVTTLDVGGGYKIARMPDEVPSAADMDKICAEYADALKEFATRTGREIKLEIEPGNYLVANAGTLLGQIREIKATPDYTFLVLNVGMNALIRPMFYGAQHPIEVLNDAVEKHDYVVQGPACESGDLLTPQNGQPGKLATRCLKKAEVGDYVAIGGAGAYGLTMAAVNYVGIPRATEIVV